MSKNTRYSIKKPAIEAKKKVWRFNASFILGEPGNGLNYKTSWVYYRQFAGGSFLLNLGYRISYDAIAIYN